MLTTEPPRWGKFVGVPPVLLGKRSEMSCSPFPKRQILDFSKLKEFADDNISNLMKMVEKISKRVENNAGNGEIARHEQFFLFQQCFQKTCTTDT